MTRRITDYAALKAKAAEHDLVLGHSWIGMTNDGVTRCCPLGLECVSAVEEPGPDTARAIGFSSDYITGFITGFDGYDATFSDKAAAPPDHVIGYGDGLLIRSQWLMDQDEG